MSGAEGGALRCWSTGLLPLSQAALSSFRQRLASLSALLPDAIAFIPHVDIKASHAASKVVLFLLFSPVHH